MTRARLARARRRSHRAVRSRGRALVAAAIAGWLGACDSSVPVEPVPLSDLSARLQDAICRWAVRCRHVPDAVTCRRLLDPKEYDTRRARDAVAAGRLLYDPDAAGRCVADTASAHCLASPFSADACAAMWTGAVPPGGACTSAFECAGGAPCERRVCDAQCCAGTCGAAPPPPEPPPAPAALGEPCSGHDDCGVGAYCDLSRRCAAMPDAPGEPCLIGCAVGDLYCDVVALECRRYAGRGEPCDPDGRTAPPCDPAWAYCDGVCRDRPAAGQPCDPRERRCVASAWCDGDPGVCRARGGAGAPCERSDQCTVACDGAHCVAYRRCTVDP